MNHLDFEGLGSYLNSISRQVLPGWLPGGRVEGNEWVCGSLRGEKGNSCRVNIVSGKWADFESGESGGDLISLYAAINHLKPGDSYRKLADDHGYKKGANTHNAGSSRGMAKNQTTVGKDKFIKPPKGTPLPKAITKSVSRWFYRDAAGEVLFIIARFDKGNGKKDMVPYSWNGEKWFSKVIPENRPLYRLDKLHPKKPVLIVEGEKAADAAAETAGKYYSVVTSQGGTNAWKKTDWSPLYGKSILIWPDADEAGIKYAIGGYKDLQGEKVRVPGIADVLSQHCPEVKYLDTKGLEDGVDAADFKFAWDKFLPFAKERVKLFEPPVKTVQAELVDDPPLPTLADMPPEVLETAEKSSLNENKSLVSTGVASVWAAADLFMTAQFVPHPISSNISKLIPHIEYKEKIWYDDFYNRVRTNYDGGKPREWSEHDTLAFLEVIQQGYRMPRMTKNTLFDGVLQYALKHKKNEPRDLISSVKWDGKPRIDNFLCTHFGAEESEYTTDCSRNWWLSMVARIFNPGCKVDNMVILEGEQGERKSSVLRMIANDGEWFIEAEGDISSKDFWQSLQGKTLVEIAELDSFNKSDIRVIKKFITKQEDKFREPYSRLPMTSPRTCVFVGTTNEHEYLQDHTGARRFWPVSIGKINYDLVKEDRWQLYAEAFHRLNEGEQWWMEPRGAKIQQEARREREIWETFILEYVQKNQKSELTIEEILVSALQIEKGRASLADKRRAGRALRALGYPYKVTSDRGRSVRKFYPNGFTQELKLEPQEEKPVEKPYNYAPGADNSGSTKPK